MNENKKIVTVGELREFIKDMSDDTQVFFVVRDIVITIFKMKECIKTVIQM